MNARPVDRAIGLLERLVPVARALAATARALALSAAAAALVIAAYLFRDGVPDDAEGRIEVVVGLALAGFPPLVLGAFWLAVREVAELPARLRSLPDTSREHAAELGRLAGEARSRGSWLRPRMLWRFGFLAASARESLTPWAPLLPLLSLPFLFATAVAAAGAILELLVAAVLLIALAL